MKLGRPVIDFIRIKSLHDIKKRRKNYPKHGEFKEINNVPYIDDNNEQHSFDVLIAKENRKNCLVIDIHGGCYIFGEHKDNYTIGYVFAKNGYDVVMVDYQYNNGKMDTKNLVDDIEKNLQYVFSHLKELGLDKDDKVVLTGDSAGGHFALLFAELFSDENFAKELGYKLPNINITSCLVNCPVYDYTHIGDGFLTGGALKRMFGPNYKNKEEVELLCPRKHIDSLKYPVFVSTCTNDFIRMHSLALKEDLEKRNLEHRFIDIENKDKAVGHVHNVIFINLKDSIYINEEMCKFIEKYNKNI